MQPARRTPAFVTLIRTFIVEEVLPERGSPAAPRDPRLQDITMLVLYGGRERGRAGFEGLCVRAGLRVLRRDGVTAVEAVRNLN
ncbi:hypothetical protein JOF53_000438 [Crossiella equi]|uniref:Transposase n=1 Tax=Crossiella equi TaxID=130796 RepID=A0ABS5A4U1_9PSEU|nr:hypothetical protein [Crossiella equi]MBP2471566.1 hypothetical protein [Crossiella equi]